MLFDMTGRAEHVEFRVLGLQLTPCVYSSVVFLGLLQILAFSSQNLLQEVIAAAAFEEGVGVGLFLTISEGMFCAVVPLCECCVDAKSGGRAAVLELVRPRGLAKYGKMAAVLSLSTCCGNLAVQHINVATLVIFKSAKLIPVMLVGLCFFKKRYSLQHWVAAAILVSGVTLCVQADATSAPRFGISGIMLALLALVGDALYPHMQEKILTSDNGTSQPFRQQQLLIATNFLSAVYAVALMGLDGAKGTAASRFLASHPWACGIVVAHGLLQYLGLFFYLVLMRIHSSRVAVSVATVRKAVSILLSSVIDQRQPSAVYCVGVVAVLLATLVERGLVACMVSHARSVARRVWKVTGSPTLSDKTAALV